MILYTIICGQNLKKKKIINVNFDDLQFHLVWDTIPMVEGLQYHMEAYYTSW